MGETEKKKTESRLLETAGPAGKNTLAVLALLLIDLLALGISLQIAITLRGVFLPVQLSALFSDPLLASTLQLLWWVPLAFLFCLAYEKLYITRMPFWVEVERVARACTLAFFMAIGFIYMAGLASLVSRSIILMVWFFSLFLIPAFRFYGKKLLTLLKVWNRPLILVGDRAGAIQVLRALERESNMGYQLLGFIAARKEQPALSSLPCLGTLRDAEGIILDQGRPDLIIAVPGMPLKELLHLTGCFQPLVNNIMVVPDLFGLTLNSMEISYFFEEQAMVLHVKNRLRSHLNRAVKRLFDMVTGAALLALSSPLFLVIALIVRLDSPGPVLYIHHRIGQGGREFPVFKFRTMYVNAGDILVEHLATCQEASSEWQEYNKLKNHDPRVTKAGRVLRRFSIDELPQLINVVRGEMSLVGPRPYLPGERDMLGSFARDILITKPGLTGLWQVSGRNNLSFESRLRLDAWYVKNWSLWLDFILLLKTLKAIARADGAY